VRHSDRQTTAYPWALIVLTVAMSDAAMAQEYTLTDLGRIEGYENTLGIAVNNLGQVAGYAWTYVEEPPHFPYEIHGALVYSDGVLTDLSTPPGTESVAAGINDAGKVAGSQNGDGVIWEKLGGVWQITTQLGPLPGGTDPMSSGGGINNQGQVAGTAQSVTGYLHAGLWESGTTLDLGTLATGDWSKATGINDRGEVVGYATSDGISTNHAFLWLPQPVYGMPAGMNDLGTLGNRVYSLALDVNDTGQVVGYSANPDRAFLWDNGVMTDLGAVANAESQANGLNDLGLVVGVSWSLDPRITGRGVLWDGGELYDLNDLVVNAPGWFIREAHDINNAGQIVGEGVSPSGEHHAVLLNPRQIAVPASSTWGLLVLSVSLLAGSMIALGRCRPSTPVA